MKRNFLILVFIELSVALYGQTGNTIMDRIIQQVKLFPQEKTYIHTDATDYLAGQRIWTKVYVVNAVTHEPVSDSQYAYIELIAPDGVLLKRIKLINMEGLYTGYIDIPQSATSGQYMLRSYTRLMTNLQGFEDTKVIYVSGNTLEKNKIKATTVSMTEHEQDMGRTIGCERQGDSLRILVDVPIEGDFYLLAHCRAVPFFLERVYPHQPVVWHRDSIPQGVVSLLLIDSNMAVKAHRQILSDNESERCQLTVTTSKETYQPEEEIGLHIDVPTLQNGEHVDLSVSFVRQQGERSHHPSSIIAHLMLASEVQGGLADPEYFYLHPNQADSLLLGKSWRRYDMARVLKGHYTVPTVLAETSQCITGCVRSIIFHKPVYEASVSLISPQTGLAAVTTTDKNGRFRFVGMDYPDGTQFVLMATRKKGSEFVNLSVDESVYPEVPFFSASVDEVIDNDVENDGYTTKNDDPFLVDGMMLEEVEVTGNRRNLATEGNVYAQMADFSFGLSRIEEMGATCLHELVRRIPGVFIRDDKAYIRANTSIFGDNPAVFAIDGVIMEGDYDLDNINMQDVARVDVFKTGSTVIWGAKGGSGVISITTKEGNYEQQTAERYNMQKIEPLGYQRPSRFLYQKGVGRTLYWNPNITEDTIHFTAPAQAGNYNVVIEGVTSMGRLIHEELHIVLP